MFPDVGGDQHDQRIMKNEYQETGGSIVGQLSGNGNFLFQPEIPRAMRRSAPKTGQREFKWTAGQEIFHTP